MKRDFYEWATEKEPTFTGRPRPVIPLSIHGAVRQYIERRAVTRCSICQIPCASSKCETCVERKAVVAVCDCGYLYEGERCVCGRAA